MSSYLCNSCPRFCNADKEKGEGFCLSKNIARVARSDLHFWEEPPLSGTNGSGTVFFTGCSLGCIFCQNKLISHGEIEGRAFTPKELSDLFFSLVEKGAHNINLVTPTHFVKEIIEALEIKKLPVPVVYNSGGYENVETIKKLNGLVNIYLPDFKYAENELGKNFSGVSCYCEIVISAIREMISQHPINVFDDNGIMQSGVIIRHLILPLHTKNSVLVLREIKKNFPNALVSLMAQYTPIGGIEKYPELNRTITKRELEKVCNEMLNLELDGFVQARKAAGKGFIPNFNQMNIE